MEKTKRGFGAAENKERYSMLTGAMFLIGFGLLFLLNIPVWPGMMVVIGLAILPTTIASSGLWAGLQGPMWLLGIAVMADANLWWPGVLILAGLSALLAALAHD